MSNCREASLRLLVAEDRFPWARATIVRVVVRHIFRQFLLVIRSSKAM